MIWSIVKNEKIIKIKTIVKNKKKNLKKCSKKKIIGNEKIC